MRGYATVQICEPTMRHTVLFEFWLLILFVFSLSGHTDTYRTVVYDDGAFELCLSCRGSFYQNNTLRSVKSSNAGRIRSEWGEHRRIIWRPPWSMVLAAGGSATRCHAVGVSGVSPWPSPLEISVTDVLGIAQ